MELKDRGDSDVHQVPDKRKESKKRGKLEWKNNAIAIYPFFPLLQRIFGC